MIRLRIGRIICSEDVIDKLEWKHNVRQFEVEEVLRGKPQVLFVEKGERYGEDVYIGKGTTEAGRYLSVIFIRKKTGDVLILSARDMTKKERKSYGKR